MILEVGSFQHRINSAGVTFNRTAILDFRELPYLATDRWVVEFRLINDTPDPKELDAKIAQIEAVYAAGQFSSARLLHDDGTPTDHVILGANTIGGVRVVKPPSYMRFQNGEYVSYRTGTVEIEATVKLDNNPFRVIEFDESIEIDGGGPEFVMLQPNVGPAIRQQTRTQLKSTATQAGTITHLGAYGVIPPPIWPGAQMRPVRVRKTTPRNIGGDFYSFQQSYSYEFESEVRLTGSPTVIA